MVLLAIQGVLGYLAAKFTSEENNVNYGRFWLAVAVGVVIIALPHFDFLQVVGISFLGIMIGMGVYELLKKFDKESPDTE